MSQHSLQQQIDFIRDRIAGIEHAATVIRTPETAAERDRFIGHYSAILATLFGLDAASRVPVPRPQLPPLDKELCWILGRPGFAMMGVARVLQRAGVFSERHAEEEQANVIYFLVNMYLKHGAEEWRKNAEAEIARMADAA